MWLRLIRNREDNPIFEHASRRLRRAWWRSWVAPGLIFVAALYGAMIAFDLFGRFSPLARDMNVTPALILRVILFAAMPLAALFGYLAGARSLQRDRDTRTLDELLMTNLSNMDLLTGKVLGGAMPFTVFATLLFPAVVIWGWEPPQDLPSIFTKNFRVEIIIDGFWTLALWEMLLASLMSAIVGVAYGIHAAARLKTAASTFSFGMVTFILLVPFGMIIIAQLAQALIEVFVRIPHAFITQMDLDFAPAKPFARAIGTLLAAWLLSLIPLGELAERFRFYCGMDDTEAPQPFRYRRPRLGPPTKPAAWTNRPGETVEERMARAQNIWIDYEKERARRPAGRRALVPRDSPHRPVKPDGEG